MEWQMKSQSEEYEVQNTEMEMEFRMTDDNDARPAGDDDYWLSVEGCKQVLGSLELWVDAWG